MIERLLLRYRLWSERRTRQEQINKAYNRHLIPVSFPFAKVAGGALLLVVLVWFFRGGEQEAPETLPPPVVAENTPKASVSEQKPAPKEAPPEKKEEAVAPPVEETLTNNEETSTEALPRLPKESLLEISGDNTLVYASSDDISEIVASLEAGSIVESIEKVGKWEKIRYGDRKIGWIHAGEKEPASDMIPRSFFSPTIEVKEKSTRYLVRQFLLKWEQAQERMDTKGIDALYDDGFEGKGGETKEQFLKRIARINSEATFVAVGIREIEIEKEDTTAAGFVTISFVEYENNSDVSKVTTKKEMTLKRAGEEFSIVRESEQ